MSIPATTTTDLAVTRMLAGEVAKSMWATAKPEATPDGAESGGLSSGAETFATLFTNVLADAIAGVDPARTRTSGTGAR